MTGQPAATPGAATERGPAATGPEARRPGRTAIALIGKGATNHLHRAEVVDAFRKRNIEVVFLVREDYLPLLDRLPSCEYVVCRFAPGPGKHERLCDLLRYVRSLYPSTDPARRRLFRLRTGDRRGVRQRVVQTALNAVARSRRAMELLVAVEERLDGGLRVEGPDPRSFDQLLMLGVGVGAMRLETALTRWARRSGLRVVHVVGNYDNLSSAGFRGIPVDRLLVWGPNMQEEAVRLQGIPPDRVTAIGAVRYSSIPRYVTRDREGFLRSIGLDPARRTVLFAGSTSAFHYFEILQVVEELNRRQDVYQLILRVYPNKMLMNSVYMPALLAYAAGRPGVYVSLADPHYASGARDREVLQIEESELWHALRHADVVVNLYSTIALEACIFDRPAINMWYFPPATGLESRGEPYPYSELIHNRRLAAYGALAVARTREELLSAIAAAVRDPAGRQRERRHAVARECGPLDGQACERLADACAEAYGTTARRGS